uniref:PHD finger protein ALFIN-LIKE n=1 Tax=Chenopodium quinoa TaxID=63459 RepID=A0A803L5P0_CHEQI
MANLEQVFKDWQGRRAGLIKALTTEELNLCLYGKPNEQWEVSLPSPCLPPEIPDPIMGINFSRDGMKKKDWLKLVAIHSDAWLLSVAFYDGASFRFDKAERALLFDMVNELPSLFEEVVAGQNVGSNELWVCRDMCETWFHAKCVKMTPAIADHIKQYTCPSCSDQPWHQCTMSCWKLFGKCLVFD